MGKNKTVLLNCTLEDGKISRKPSERASLPEALAKSLAGLGLAEILDQVAQTPPAGALDADVGDTGSGDSGADSDADIVDAGKGDDNG